MSNLSKIRILGHDYKVTFDPIMSVKRDANGECCSNIGFIKINSSISLSQQKDTIIHECLEAINYNLELKLEHHQISAIACSLQQVFSDNPELMSWLQEKNLDNL